MTKVVAPNILNPFSVMHDLPLMESEKRAQIAFNGIGVHRIVVPSDLGGRLLVGFGKQPDPKDNALVVFDPHGQPHAPDEDGRVRIIIPPGKRGDGVCLANVQAPSKQYSIFALFDEIGCAREEDGTPLIPWNFWFWPYAEDAAWAGPESPLARWERAFKTQGARDWEEQFHGDPDGTRKGWEGHCHDAAPASIVFQPPPSKGLTYRGIEFSCEQLKLIATEFFGRYGLLDLVWRLPGPRHGDLHTKRPSDDPKLFGSILPNFLEKLRFQIRSQGNALTMDLRAGDGIDPAEIWNHAVYQYSIRYWQPDASDPTLTRGLLVLNANADLRPPADHRANTGSPGVPTIMDGQQVVYAETSGRNQEARFVLRFTKTGRYDHHAPETEWRSMELSSASIHAPRNAGVPTVLPEQNWAPTGNLEIEKKDALRLLRLRERFA